MPLMLNRMPMARLSASASAYCLSLIVVLGGVVLRSMFGSGEIWSSLVA